MCVMREEVCERAKYLSTVTESSVYVGVTGETVEGECDWREGE
jgi:hypothetical protein